MSFALKICGVSNPQECALLNASAVSYAGLWWGMTDGAHNLSTARFVQLAESLTANVRPVCVTFSQDVAAMVNVLRNSGTRHLQLHGFQLPAVISRVRAALGDDVTIFKVIHVKDLDCLEASLLKHYQRAGVDLFILDTFVSRLQLGSTGRQIPLAALQRWLDRLGPDRTLVAGGVDAERIGELRRLWPELAGVDIDSAARSDGGICGQRLAQLIQATLLGATVNHGSH
ncbi:MAG: hypothetical protein HY308_00630 [Gammaproteobacteria bacterium]|nr:hypothetical protein [Gammaproteobacteria bacterium]